MNRCRAKRRDRLPLLPALFLLVIAACAEIGRPPGGEVDNIGPRLVGSHPENEAVQVPPGNQISLYFSEPLIKPTSGNPVFISPRPRTKPRLKWKSDRIIIILPDSFKASQTYIVTVSSTVTDLRRNRLDSSATIAFSTGASVDTGTVGGIIFKDDATVTGTIMALYDLEAVGDTLAYDSLYPDYLTVSDSKGRFCFRYLPEKEYRLIGFLDRNRDERLNPFREPFAVPDRDIVVGGRLPLESLNMRLTSLDTLRPEILSASQTPDGLIRIRMSKKILLDGLGSDPRNITLSDTRSQKPSIPAVSFLESDAAESASLTVFFGPIPRGTYRLDVKHDSVEAALTYEELEIKQVKDETSPTVVAFEPQDRPLFVGQVQMRMYFSEPLDTGRITDQTFVLWQSGTRTVPLSWRWADQFHLWLEPDTVKPGLQYRLDVTEFELADLAGNLLGDSLSQFVFSTLDSDSLGWISGDAAVLISERVGNPVLLSFLNTATGHVFDLPVTDRQFKIDVPAGKYLMSGFVDSDGNGVWSTGSLFPLVTAETMAHYPDTIAVRARFETAAILFEFR